jgi:hypothetical protein
LLHSSSDKSPFTLSLREWLLDASEKLHRNLLEPQNYSDFLSETVGTMIGSSVSLKVVGKVAEIGL